MMKCLICQVTFNDQIQAQQIACRGVSSHVLQETIDGTRDPDTGEQADFRSVDENDLRKWGKEAKDKFGYE